MVAFSSDAIGRGARRLSSVLHAAVGCERGSSPTPPRSGKRSIAALVPADRLWLGGAGRAAAGRRAGTGPAPRGDRAPIPSTGSACRRRSANPAALKSGQADALFVPEGGDALPLIAQSLTASGVNPQSVQLLGTGVWDDPRIFADPLLQGGLYAARRQRLPRLRRPLPRPLRAGSGSDRQPRL